MTVLEAAAHLGILPKSVENLVYAGRIRPSSGTGGRSWTFSLDEFERYDRSRIDGINARRAWNGSRPVERKA